MTPEEQALHTRLGKLKGRLFNLIGKIESAQLVLVSNSVEQKMCDGEDPYSENTKVELLKKVMTGEIPREDYLKAIKNDSE